MTDRFEAPPFRNALPWFIVLVGALTAITGVGVAGLGYFETAGWLVGSGFGLVATGVAWSIVIESITPILSPGRD